MRPGQVSSTLATISGVSASCGMTRGGDEAADLDLAHAGGGDGGDPAHLGVGRHAGLGDLQPVARADFADGDEFAHGAGDLRGIGMRRKVAAGWRERQGGVWLMSSVAMFGQRLCFCRQDSLCAFRHARLQPCIERGIPACPKTRSSPNSCTALDARYGDRLERAVLFGSRARGDARPDFDFDVAVGLRDYTDLWNGYGRSARSPPISSRIPER